MRWLTACCDCNAQSDTTVQAVDTYVCALHHEQHPAQCHQLVIQWSYALLLGKGYTRCMHLGVCLHTAAVGGATAGPPAGVASLRAGFGNNTRSAYVTIPTMTQQVLSIT